MGVTLSAATQTEIARMTKIIAGKIGYDAATGDAPQGMDKKMGGNGSYQHFSEEMNGFIAENVNLFMARGLAEKEALIATQQKFSGDGFAKSMNEFFKKYGGVKEMEKPSFSRPALAHRAAQKPIIPMLYAAFALIGIGFGALVGKIVSMLLPGIICGLIIGIGLGIVTHAVVLIEEDKK